MISHRGAYSKFVSPAPPWSPGRNRFQSPAGTGFRLELLDDRRRLPAILLDLLVEALLIGIDVLVHERAESVCSSKSFADGFEVIGVMVLSYRPVKEGARFSRNVRRPL